MLRPILLATILLATAVETSPAQSLSVPVVVDTLPNGLTLLVHEDHSVPIVAVNVWYHVGSGDEQPGHTGFAHLFEHLMFMGSENAEYPAFDRLLEAAGASNNGSTTNDRTNYYEVGPSNSLPLMLWLEADRMGWFLPTMNAEKVDLQRDVVKNERRQSYENRPYEMAWETLSHALYPAGHPYSWSVIGSMADLSAASLEDTREFFRRYYAPNNAVIAVAGDVQAALVRQEAMKYFGPIPRGPAIERPRAPAFSLAKDTMIVLEDKVQLPRLYYNWHTVKTLAGDDAPLELLAYILTGARNSRLTDALVYDQELAADVNSFQDGKRLDGDFVVFATARPGHELPELQAAMDEQLARIIAEGPTEREVEQARNDIESNFLNGLERVLRKADQLNRYYYFAGTADWFQQDLERYQSVTAADIQRVAREYLAKPKVVLSIVPEGRTDMAARSVEATP